MPSGLAHKEWGLHVSEMVYRKVAFKKWVYRKLWWFFLKKISKFISLMYNELELWLIKFGLQITANWFIENFLE